MKKSFMTRALATGLSLAMAFSLTAVTNVSTASAAVKPAMKASAMTVKEGKSRTYLATAKTLKTYKITKAVVKNASAKEYISVKKNAKGTGIVVTGKKAGTTGRKIVITFKNKTTKKTTTLTTKVVVKAVEKEEALSMTAAATGVKKIVVTFNKAVASTPAITLTKGSVKPAVAETVWNAEKTEATIKTSGKLTQGTYTVSTTVDSETLTADVVVEKDETLTSFALVGSTLKAKDTKNTTTASIEYKALNQYGEAMNCSTTNVTIAPGKMAATGQKTPTASSAGKAVVEDIPTLYTIAGSEFSIVIVDTTTGVTLNTKAVYGASAKAAKVESAGLYNKSKGKIMDMTAGDTVSNYVALFKVTDQYGDPYTVSKSDVYNTTAMISAVAASGVTNVKVAAFEDEEPIVTVDDTEYFAVPLTYVGTTKTAVAGDFSITLVNSNLGVIGTPSYTVADSTLIASLDISADAIYAGQSNTMTYSATDTKGNAVTSYDALKGITFQKGSDNGVLAWSKNADGTAKLIYDATTISSALKSSVETFTATANPVTSSSYLVKTFTFTKLAQRKAVAVVGVSKSFATSTDVVSKEITLKIQDLQIEDQYGNLFTASELKADKLVSKSAIFVSGAAIDNSLSVAKTDEWAAKPEAAADATSGAAISTGITFYAPNNGVAVTTSFNINVNGKTSEGYTLKMYKIAASALKNITNLEIESINGGYQVYNNNGVSLEYNIAFSENTTATGEAISGKSIPVVVSGKVSGQKVYVTSSIADAEVSVDTLPTYNSSSDAKTVTAKLTVLVSTESGPVTLTKEFEVSNVPGYAKTIVANSDYSDSADTDTNNDSLKASAFKSGAYTSRDQYGAIVADSSTTKYTLNVKKVVDASGNDITSKASNGTEYVITNNSMNSASISVAENHKVTVNVSIVGTDVNYDITLTNPNP